MPDAISNTSPLLYLHRVDGIKWLPGLFTGIYVPGAVVFELMEGKQKGYDVPNPAHYDWIRVVEPRVMPSEWFAVDLGMGEIAAMSLAEASLFMVVSISPPLFPFFPCSMCR